MWLDTLLEIYKDGFREYVMQLFGLSEENARWTSSGCCCTRRTRAPVHLWKPTCLSRNLRFWLCTHASCRIAPYTAGSYSKIVCARSPASIYGSSGILHHWYSCDSRSSILRFVGWKHRAGLLAHRNKCYVYCWVCRVGRQLLLDNASAVVAFPPTIAEKQSC